MDNEIKTEEIRKTKVFSRWVVFHSLSLLVAFFYYSYLDAFNEDVIHMRGGGKVFGALGVFTLVMLIPWTIALINRLWKKQPSTTGLFIVYYVILFLWTFYFVTWGMMLHSYLNLNFWSKFKDDSRFAVFFTSLFFLIVFYISRFLIIKASRYQPNKVIANNHPEPKPSINSGISKKQKEEKFLLILFILIFLIIVVIILKELSS